MKNIDNANLLEVRNYIDALLSDNKAKEPPQETKKQKIARFRKELKSKLKFR